MRPDQIKNQKVNAKIKTPKEFVLLAKQLRKSRKTLVQCDGVFDLVHLGHIDCFWRAKAKGDILYVVLVADKFVQKGPGRPLFTEDLRAMWVAAIEGVDFVIINDDYGPRKLIREIRPHFLVKGAQYQTNPSEGFLLDKALVESYGGKVAFVKELAHSSEILKRIYQEF
jgi:rfaE bifunctional protein nucleotidyltransferase chain/domain